jgi:hypothetical protein
VCGGVIRHWGHDESGKAEPQRHANHTQNRTHSGNHHDGRDALPFCWEKTMKYKSVSVTKRGGPQVLQITENDLRLPAAGEVLKVLATGVGRTDINYHYGYSPFSPKVPFVPGYEMMGVVNRE